MSISNDNVQATFFVGKGININIILIKVIKIQENENSIKTCFKFSRKPKIFCLDLKLLVRKMFILFIKKSH